MWWEIFCMGLNITKVLQVFAIKLSNFQKNNIAKLHPKIQHSSYHDVVPLHFRLLLNQFFTLQLQAEKRKNTVKTNLLFPNCYYARCTSILEVALSVCLSLRLVSISWPITGHRSHNQSHGHGQLTSNMTEVICLYICLFVCLSMCICLLLSSSFSKLTSF